MSEARKALLEGVLAKARCLDDAERDTLRVRASQRGLNTPRLRTADPVPILSPRPGRERAQPQLMRQPHEAEAPPEAQQEQSAAAPANRRGSSKLASDVAAGLGKAPAAGVVPADVLTPRHRERYQRHGKALLVATHASVTPVLRDARPHVLADPATRASDPSSADARALRARDDEYEEVSADATGGRTRSTRLLELLIGLDTCQLDELRILFDEGGGVLAARELVGAVDWLLGGTAGTAQANSAAGGAEVRGDPAEAEDGDGKPALDASKALIELRLAGLACPDDAEGMVAWSNLIGYLADHLVPATSRWSQVLPPPRAHRARRFCGVLCAAVLMFA